MQDKIYIAKIGKTVGLHGELKLHLDTDFPEQFKKDTQFTLSNNTIVTIESFNKKRSVVKFKDFDNCDIARKLINKEVFTTTEDSKDTCNLSSKQYFWFDIINCTIIDTNIALGTVKDIHRYGDTDYLEVTTTKELIQKDLPKTFMIPYVDQYILDVDTSTKTIQTSKAIEILENS